MRLFIPCASPHISPRLYLLDTHSGARDVVVACGTRPYGITATTLFARDRDVMNTEMYVCACTAT
eukprot:14899915-Alexandrium_andersonii.AAC.1